MVVIIFLLYLTLVSLPDTLSRLNFNRADWVQFYHLYEEEITLDTIAKLEMLIESAS